MSSRSSLLIHKLLKPSEVGDERPAHIETCTDVSPSMSPFTSLKRLGVVETVVLGVDTIPQCVIKPGEETQFAGMSAACSYATRGE